MHRQTGQTEAQLTALNSYFQFHENILSTTFSSFIHACSLMNQVILFWTCNLGIQ